MHSPRCREYAPPLLKFCGWAVQALPIRFCLPPMPCLTPTDIAINVLFTLEMLFVIIAAGGPLEYLR